MNKTLEVLVEARPEIHQKFGGQCSPEDVSRYVLTPASYECVEKTALKLDNSRQVASHYEWLVYSGEYKGVPITVCSTGIGGASVAVALEELADLGADTFLRIDYAEPATIDFVYRGLIIPTGAIRFDGISEDYVRTEYPAFPHHETLLATISAAESLGLDYRTEIICSMAALATTRSDGFGHYRSEQVGQLLNNILRSGVNFIDGESATSFVICGLHGFRCGAIHVLPEFDENGGLDDRPEDVLIRVGLETIFTIAKWDQKTGSRGGAHIYPKPIL